jgi:restriction system protein
MSVWEYKSQTKDTLHRAMCSVDCPYCRSALHRYDSIFDYRAWGATEEWRVRACRTCGWWKIANYFDDPEGNLSIRTRSAAAGSLKRLDLTSLETPLTEVRDYLIAHYDSRFRVNPYLFEHVVGSVFKDLHYEVVVTGRSGDNGIDVLLHKGDEIVGVQVKRYHGSIKTAQIRELLGALVIHGYTKGMFVTTSQFQSGADTTAAMAATRGLDIALVDGESFFDALRLSQRPKHESLDIKALIAVAQLTHVNDFGVQYIGMHSEEKQDLIHSLRGPMGPIENWP